MVRKAGGGSRRKARKVGMSSDTRKIAVKALKRVNEIGKPEYKAIYTHATALSPYTGGLGYFLLLNGVSQGDGLSSREGRIIRNRSVQINIQHRANASASSNYPIRMILFIDLEPSGSAPTASQLLRTSEGQNLDEAFRNLDNRNRFIILKDKYVQGNNYDNNGSTLLTHYHKWVKFKKLNLLTTFNANNGATIADIQKGALYLFMYQGEPTYPPSVWVSAVVRFTDN